MNSESIPASTISTNVLTKLERKWFKEYLECFNATDALRRAYPNNQYTKDSERSIAWQTKKSVFNKLHIDDDHLLDTMGLTAEKAYNKIGEKMHAQDTVITGVKDEKGNPKVLKVDNHAIQFKAAETILKLHGKMKDTSRVELTGADGDPLRIELVAGIGFLNKPPDAHN